MTLITKRRLASLASASAIVATMAVAALPGATMAADAARPGSSATARTSPHASIPRHPSPGRSTRRLRHRRLLRARPSGTVTADISGAK